MERAAVLFGTVTGGAEDLASELAGVLEEAGLEAETVDMMDARAGFFEGGQEERAVVVCVATHGDGELPPDAADFFETLEEEQPDLTSVSFGVCGLGDSGYEEFCGAGRLMSGFLAGLGAKEMVERHEIDGFIGEEEVEAAREWVRQAAAVFMKTVSGCS